MNPIYKLLEAGVPPETIKEMGYPAYHVDRELHNLAMDIRSDSLPFEDEAYEIGFRLGEMDSEMD